MGGGVASLACRVLTTVEIGMGTPESDCPECRGTGMVRHASEPPHPPQFDRCGCVLRKDVLENVDRGLVGLSRAPTISSSPLVSGVHENLWITEGSSFLSHLRHVAVRMSPTWFFRVTSDAELVTAWLASVALKGQEIIDPDAYMVSTKHLTITDLVTPPDLLVIRMGVKVARNQAAAEVLAEALNERSHTGKPTWVWDEPHHPLNPGHLFWSDEVARILRGYKRVERMAVSPERKKTHPVAVTIKDEPSSVQSGGKPAGTSGFATKSTRKSFRGGR